MNEKIIFTIATIDYNENKEVFRGIKNSYFSVIEKIIRGVISSPLSEEEKKEKLGKLLTKVLDTNSSRVMGTQVIHLRKIINSLFQVKHGKFNNNRINDFTMNEILFYYCMIARMAISNYSLTKDDVESANRQYSLYVEEENKKAEELIKERQKREQEILAKNEAQRKAEEERLASLSLIDRKIELLPKDKTIENEAAYIEFYNSLDEFQGEDKIRAAKILKEFWTSVKKWDIKLNDKKFKQAKKVVKVKNILNEL